VPEDEILGNRRGCNRHSQDCQQNRRNIHPKHRSHFVSDGWGSTA
jgi:hypothetical protein